MYRYETHLHTSPVSKCACVSVRDNLELYKKLGYDGVFITNHFIDGNINYEKKAPYVEKLKFYFSDYEEALSLENEIGIRVFLGIEMSYKGTDFLIYGLDMEWYFAHPEIEGMKKSELLTMLMQAGALVIQAHPYREASYIDHIRLFPRHVHGVEVYNACRTDFENTMAERYAESYGLIPFSGTDNHRGSGQAWFGGVELEAPIDDEKAFTEMVFQGKAKIFKLENPFSGENDQRV